jgi:hypothetical protein
VAIAALFFYEDPLALSQIILFIFRLFMNSLSPKRRDENQNARNSIALLSGFNLSIRAAFQNGHYDGKCREFWQ